MEDKSIKTWVYGRDGWYVALNGWKNSYSNDLKSLGYDVEKSDKKPERNGNPREVRSASL